ncbi:radial spoke head protein 9 homolog [Branchiostoma floridae]|uniref:Radial spoke head protein 9 homolog n=1 Tax=Branchiostoma floridae TaxID=7739 RepID=C3Y0E7_BRAFL|nr:radial spoke head protein 9 homolog [Branchiostoma floridae]|eukprot:XP_002610210.1 hypothetical protein BRAFLDRAFT_121507 [Branchiostoma floridae]
MDSEDLIQYVDFVASSGVVLSSEQKAALQTSLVIMKNHYKFHRVYLWGKILGIKDDYFIAQGVSRDEMAERKTLYSLDCVQWNLLPPATKAMRDHTSVVKGRFTGDPSYEYEHTEIRKIGEGEDATEEEHTIQVKEEDRLTSVIATIDEEVAIAPRGAFIKTPHGEVIRNRSFEGLSVSEAGKLNSYFHLREPLKLKEKTLLEKADLDPSIDFLDSIEEDIPRGGSWSVQFERGSGLVALRSLVWLGYTFFHVPGTLKFGSMYIGNGEKNNDLPFML